MTTFRTYISALLHKLNKMSGVSGFMLPVNCKNPHCFLYPDNRVNNIKS